MIQPKPTYDTEALNMAWQDAKKQGYADDLPTFHKLLKTDKEALDMAYSDAKNQGYTDSFDDFSNLLGVKKKESTESSSTSRGRNSVSGATSGFLGTQPTKLGSTVLPSKTVSQKQESLTDKEKRLSKELANVKVTPTNMDIVSKKTDELSLTRKLIKQQNENAKTQRIDVLKPEFDNFVYNPQDNDEVENRLQERLKMSGASNVIETGLKRTYNSTLGQLAFMPSISLDPLADEKKQAKAEAAKQGIKLTQVELDKRAKEIFKKTEYDKIIEDRASRFLENLDDEDKDLLQQNSAKEITHLNQENSQAYKTAKALQSFAQQRAKKYQELEAKLLNDKKNGVPISQEDISRLNVLRGEVNNTIEGMNRQESKILKNTKDLGTVEQEYDLFKREYGDLWNFASKAQIGIDQAALGLLDWTNYLASNYGNPLDKLRAMQGHEISKDLKQGLAEQEETLRKPVKSFESASGVVNYLSDLAATQVPIMAAASTGVGGLTALGMSTAGQKSAEMVEEQKNGANYAPWQMMAVPIAHGGAEVISEIPTASILNKGKRVLEAAAKGSREMLEQSAKERAQKYIKDFGFDMLKEQGGEHFTNLIQNFDDKYLLGKKDVELFDNTGQVFKDTFFLTSLMKAMPHVGGAVLKTFQSADQLKELDINSKKIKEFASQMNNESLSADEKEIIKKNIDKLTSESQTIINTTIDNVGQMPKVVYNEVLNTTKRIGEIKSEAETIKNGSATNKKELLQELQKEYTELQNKRNKIISNEVRPTDVLPQAEVDSLKKQALSELQKENTYTNGKVKEFKDEEILDKANEIYLKKEAEQEKAAKQKETKNAKTEISDIEYENFINKGEVTSERLNEIANKVKNNEKLSEKENAIFVDKTAEINKIISNGKSDTRSTFEKANALFEQIKNTEGVSKKRTLSEQTREILSENPSVKLVYDNISEIHKQLENATDENGEKIFEKKGDCP